MINTSRSSRFRAAALLLAALPLSAVAQNRLPDSLLRRGDLVGARPPAPGSRAAALARRPAAAFPTTTADPGLARLLHESVDLARVPATQLPDLYARFLEVTRAERRQWAARDWDGASATLARLNARYEQVRLDLPLDERLRIRSAQGEFRTLQGARRVKDRLRD